MIKFKGISDFNHDSEEGKVLFAAIAILTSIEHRHIDSGQFGSHSHPDVVLRYVTDLANKLYYEEEWKIEKLIKDRDSKIEELTSKTSK